MKAQKARRRPLYWLVPLLLALPFAAVTVWAAEKYLPQAEDLLHIAMKLVILP